MSIHRFGMARVVALLLAAAQAAQAFGPNHKPDLPKQFSTKMFFNNSDSLDGHWDGRSSGYLHFDSVNNISHQDFTTLQPWLSPEYSAQMTMWANQSVSYQVVDDVCRAVPPPNNQFVDFFDWVKYAGFYGKMKVLQWECK